MGYNCTTTTMKKKICKPIKNEKDIENLLNKEWEELRGEVNSEVTELLWVFPKEIDRLKKLLNKLNEKGLLHEVVSDVKDCLMDCWQDIHDRTRMLDDDTNQH